MNIFQFPHNFYPVKKWTRKNGPKTSEGMYWFGRSAKPGQRVCIGGFRGRACVYGAPKIASINYAHMNGFRPIHRARATRQPEKLPHNQWTSNWHTLCVNYVIYMVYRNYIYKKLHFICKDQRAHAKLGCFDSFF